MAVADLEELTGADAGATLHGAVAMAVLLATLLTWPTCALLLALYRRAVNAGMRRTGAQRSSPPAACGAPVVAAAARAPGRRIAVREVEGGQGHRLLRLARRRARRAQLVFAAAGLLFGLTSTAVYTVLADLDWRPVRTLSLTLILGWLVVPSVIAQGVVSRRAQLGFYAGYLGLLVALPVFGGLSVRDVLVLLLIVAVGPGLFVLATGVPALRGAAWLVAPALVLVGVAAPALYPAALYLWFGAPVPQVLWWLAASAVGLLAAGVVYGWAVAALHARKWTSDQTLLVLQWWLVLVAGQALLVASSGATAAALALTPFAVLVLFLFTVALLRRDDGRPPVRLLLLRTFGARRRSSRLLRDVTAQWRWIGSVELITGTDVATEVLEPQEFLDFLRRRLAKRFVSDVDQVAQRVGELDLRPDRDGRFRVNDLLCHAHTWQPMVQALLADSDAVLVDLRGLTAGNAGVLHEVECLVATFPLERVVALVDGSTDVRVLQEVLDRAAGSAPASSPLHDAQRPALHVVALTGRRSTDVTRVLAAVAAAAAGEPAGEAVSAAPAVVLPRSRVPADEPRTGSDPRTRSDRLRPPAPSTPTAPAAGDPG